ncbi:MAG: hypothetical protein NTY60_00630 [Proteobacteria bacterium]|nr:hypothetical protein [Pseudomonadota bacterium]
MRFALIPTLTAVVVAGVLVAPPVHADVSLNAGVRVSQDNNVNGSPDTPNKANQHSDTYQALNAGIVYFTPLDDAKTRYFIGQAGAMATSYNNYNNLDGSMLIASAGIYQQLAPTWSGQLMGRGFSRYTRQPTRDSGGFGGTLEVKKQLTQTFWLKGVADYEDNRANLSTYSYTGNTWGMNLGYVPLADTFVNVGFSQNNRDFKTSVPFRTSTQMLFVELSQRLTKNWYLNGGYASMKNDSNYAGTAYTNHVLSIGVSCSF